VLDRRGFSGPLRDHAREAAHRFHIVCADMLYAALAVREQLQLAARAVDGLVIAMVRIFVINCESSQHTGFAKKSEALRNDLWASVAVARATSAFVLVEFGSPMN
jgi:hypothetical protein